MTEYPVFVPSGDGRIGAVLTVPDGSSRGLVLLIPGGGGAPRSHRYGMFTKVARALAERGISSMRMEARGVGESSGNARYSFNALPVEDTLNVARFALRAIGDQPLGIAANCGGARTALRLIPVLPEVRAAVLMMLKPRAGTRSQKAPVRTAKRLVRRIPRLGSTLRSARYALHVRRTTPVFEGLQAAHDTADLLLLEAATVKVGRLPRFVAGLRAKHGPHRLEMRTMPGGSTKAFQDLDRQDFVLAAIVEWFDEEFPAGTEAPDPALATTS
jgi:alpha/beta superfamily hydrolase